MCVLVGVALFLRWPGPVAAQPSPEPLPPDAARKVVLVDLPPSLAEAIEVSIGAWGATTVRVGPQKTSASMPGTANAARDVAAAEGAAAVVWISTSDSGAAIWIYDTADDRATATELNAPPPYDDPTAAAIALTVKTLLRHSVAAPKTERFGAPEVTEPAPIAPVAPTRRRLAVIVGAGARYRSTVGTEARLAVSGQYDLGYRFGAELGLRAGLGGELGGGESAAIAGRLQSGALSARASYRLWQSGPASLAATAGVDLELLRYSVTAPVERDLTRFNPGFVVGGSGIYWMQRGLGLRLYVEGVAMLRRQRLENPGMGTRALPRAELETGLSLVLQP